MNIKKKKFDFGIVSVILILNFKNAIQLLIFSEK